MVKSIFHLNINCSNFERSVEFYKMLGFRVVMDIPEGGSEQMSKGLGLKNAVGRAAILMIGDDRRATRIDLIEWKRPRNQAKPYAKLNHLGIARVALYSNNFHEDYENLKSKGVKFISDPVVMHTRAGDGRFVCFYDPDGVVLELMEFVRPEQTAQPAQDR
jgi:glyoxylase I family protein